MVDATERFTRLPDIRVVSTEDDSAAGFQSSSDFFAKLSEQAFDIAKADQSREGETAGAAAGIARDEEGRLTFERRDTGLLGPTAFDRGYNESARITFLQSIQTDIDISAKTFALQFSEDPVGFAAEFDGFMKGLLEGVPEELRGHVAAAAERIGGLEAVGITANVQQSDAENSVANYTDQTAAGLDRIRRLIEEYGPDSQQVADEYEAYLGMVQVQAGLAALAGGIDLATAQSSIDELDQAVYQATLNRNVRILYTAGTDREEGLDAAMKYLDEELSNPTADLGASGYPIDIDSSREIVDGVRARLEGMDADQASREDSARAKYDANQILMRDAAIALTQDLARETAAMTTPEEVHAALLKFDSALRQSGLEQKHIITVTEKYNAHLVNVLKELRDNRALVNRFDNLLTGEESAATLTDAEIIEAAHHVVGTLIEELRIPPDENGEGGSPPPMNHPRILQNAADVTRNIGVIPPQYVQALDAALRSENNTVLRQAYELFATLSEQPNSKQVMEKYLSSSTIAAYTRGLAVDEVSSSPVLAMAYIRERQEQLSGQSPKDIAARLGVDFDDVVDDNYHEASMNVLRGKAATMIKRMLFGTATPLGAAVFWIRDFAAFANPLNAKFSSKEKLALDDMSRTLIDAWASGVLINMHTFESWEDASDHTVAARMNGGLSGSRLMNEGREFEIGLDDLTGFSQFADMQGSFDYVELQIADTAYASLLGAPGEPLLALSGAREALEKALDNGNLWLTKDRSFTTDNPAWNINYVNQHGMYEYLRDGDDLLRWVPNPNSLEARVSAQVAKFRKSQEELGGTVMNFDFARKLMVRGYTKFATDAIRAINRGEDPSEIGLQAVSILDIFTDGEFTDGRAAMILGMSQEEIEAIAGDDLSGTLFGDNIQALQIASDAFGAWIEGQLNRQHNPKGATDALMEIFGITKEEISTGSPTELSIPFRPATSPWPPTFSVEFGAPGVESGDVIDLITDRGGPTLSGLRPVESSEGKVWEIDTKYDTEKLEYIPASASDVGTQSITITAPQMRDMLSRAPIDQLQELLKAVRHQDSDPELLAMITAALKERS
jgi:hypothetical protein